MSAELVKCPDVITSRKEWISFLLSFNAYKRREGTLKLYQFLSDGVLAQVDAISNGNLRADDDIIEVLNKKFQPKDRAMAKEVLGEFKMARNITASSISIANVLSYIAGFSSLLKTIPNSVLPSEATVLQTFLRGISPRELEKRITDLEPKDLKDAYCLLEREAEAIIQVQAYFHRNVNSSSNSSSPPPVERKSVSKGNHNGGERVSSTIICHNCGIAGHKRPDCPKLTLPTPSSSPVSSSSSSNSSSSSAPSTSTLSKTPATSYNLRNNNNNNKNNSNKSGAASKKLKEVEKGQEKAAIVDISLHLPQEKGIVVKALLDSGSTSSFIKTSLLQKNGVDVSKLEFKEKEIVLAIGPPMKIQCASLSMMISMVISGRTVKYNNIFFITNDLSEDVILGLNVMNDLDISASSLFATDDEIQEEYDEIGQQPEIMVETTFEYVYEKYKSVFSPLDGKGADLPPLKLTLKQGATLKSTPPRRLSPAQREATMKEVNKFEEAGIIQPCVTSFVSPTILVRKPDNSWRLCVDYRNLNGALEDFQYPLPNNKDLIQRMGGFNLYSKLDLKTGFHQVPLDPSTRYLSSFVTPDGTWEYLFVSMGLKPAPMWFQYVMVNLLSDLTSFAFVFIDDIVIGANSEKEMRERLDLILSRLENRHVRLNRDKCVFGVPCVEYLGFVVDKEGLKISPSRVSTIRGLSPPSTIHGIRSFIGLLNFFRDFIPEFAVRTKMFTSLTSASKLDWTDELQQEFEKLKQDIAKAPLLHHIDYDKPIYLSTDASTLGVGGVLFQHQQEGDTEKKNIICYVSRAFNGTEQKWSTIEQEAFGIYFSIMSLRGHLLGHKFTVLTDHRNLTYLAKAEAAKIVRWRLNLQQFDFDIVHVPGKMNTIPDALSRCYKLYGQEDKLELLMSVHNHLIGHLGSDQTIQRLRDLGEDWDDMEDDVKKFIHACATCQKGSSVGTHNKSHGQPYITSKYSAFESISIDTQEYPADKDGYRYVIAIQDMFTRIVRLYRCASRDSMDAAEALMDWFCLFGPPRLLCSDMGTQFVNQVISDFQSLLGSHQKVALEAHHQAQGMVENTFKETLRHLSAIVFNARVKDTWSRYLPLAQRILNGTRMSATGFTPNQMVFGSSVLSLHLRRSPTTSPVIVSEYVKDVESRMQEIQIASAKHLDEMLKAKMKKQQNVTTFDVGDYILMSWPDNKRPDKLSPKLQGPFEVVKTPEKTDNPPSVYVVKNLTTNNNESVHVSRLYPYDATTTHSPTAVAALDHDEWIVEKILDHRPKPLPKQLKKREFKVQYHGYGTSDDDVDWLSYLDVKDLEAYSRYMESFKTSG